jgi:hypothetical protein
MKMKIVSVLSGVTLLAGLAMSPVANAENSPDVSKVLAGSSALELSAKSASLVAKASASDKKDVAVSVVKTAVAMNPAAVAAVVSAVVRESQENAPVVAVTASKLQPKRIGQIAKAAAAAAPTQAARIVAALVREFPRNYGMIASAAAAGAPMAGREILAVVAESVPALQASIQTASARYSANELNLPVQAILSQAISTQVTAGLMPGYDENVVFGTPGAQRTAQGSQATELGAPILASTVPTMPIPRGPTPVVSDNTLTPGGLPGAISNPTTFTPANTQPESDTGRTYDTTGP